MTKKKTAALSFFVLMSCTSFGINIDTLKTDSVMQTTGIKTAFKGGTAYKTDKNGFVIEGTPASDTDLWTTGPLVYFSSEGIVKFNSKGKVTQGVLAVNILANCLDNKFREFKRGTRVFFDNEGLVFRGTLNESIEITVDNQIVRSADNSPIEFYASGRIKQITPSANFKFLTAEGIRILISSDNPIKLDEKGNLREGFLAKKLSFHNGNETITMSIGQLIKFDEKGNIIY